ncbi:hypothetical protein [Paenibacillus kandeliae]|uniref:hypothetical protein n=1 Tax=Paenibacillus kandeliae TaxID=3231269 RepID=UPI00345AF67A
MADSINNNQLKSTMKYFDQIQRASERFGRTRYQNILKLNNELKFTVRYIDNIYRSANRLAGLRLSPQIKINDQASKEINNLSKKLITLRSEMISVFGKSSITIKQNSESSQQKAPSFEGLIAALQSNTKALKSYANAVLLSNANNKKDSEKKEEPKTFKDKAKDFFDHVKSTGEGGKNLVGTFTKFKEIKDLAKGKNLDESNTSNSDQNPSGDNNDEDSSSEESRLQRGRRQRRERRERRVKIASGVGELIESFGGAGSGLIDGVSGLMDDFGSVKDWMTGSGSGSSAASSSAASTVARAGVEGVEEAGEGALKGFLKGGAKKLLGPLSYGLDAANIVQATDGRERSEAIGSMAGSAIGTGIGGAIGTAILPGIGTAAGSYVGGMVGDVVGSKIGGWVSDNKEVISQKISSFTSGIADFFTIGKKEIESTPKITPVTIPKQASAPITSPMMTSPLNNALPNSTIPFNPAAVTISAAGEPTSMRTTKLQENATSKSKGTALNGDTVQISEAQMGTISGMLKDFKAQVTNAVSVNIPAGAVQVTVQENEIDYDALVLQIGQRVVNELRKSMQNRKSDSPGNTSAKPIMA